MQQWIIDLSALLVSVAAFVKSIITDKRQDATQQQLLQLEREKVDLQRRLAELELRREQERKEAQSRADVIAKVEKRITQNGKLANRLVLYNVGGAPAHDVTLTMQLRPGQLDPIPPSVKAELLPINILHPTQPYEIPLSISFESEPPYDVEIMWRDPDGTERKKSMVVTWG